jgi:ATP-binding cassette subfamily G (WHITE) protein 2 (SNQ2)
MTHLVRDAGAFFTFYLMIVTGYLAMTLFFRTVGCLCPDFDVAIRLAATIITLFVLTSGYIIQWQSEQVWLRWIFYINALGLGFSALMMSKCHDPKWIRSAFARHTLISYLHLSQMNSVVWILPALVPP